MRTLAAFNQLRVRLYPSSRFTVAHRSDLFTGGIKHMIRHKLYIGRSALMSTLVNRCFPECRISLARDISLSCLYLMFLEFDAHLPPVVLWLFWAVRVLKQRFVVIRVEASIDGTPLPHYRSITHWIWDICLNSTTGSLLHYQPTHTAQQIGYEY